MSGILSTNVLGQIQASLLPTGAASRERRLEELSTEELEARVLLNQERLRLVERGAFWGGFGSAFWGAARLLK